MVTLMTGGVVEDEDEPEDVEASPALAGPAASAAVPTSKAAKSGPSSREIQYRAKVFRIESTPFFQMGRRERTGARSRAGYLLVPLSVQVWSPQETSV